LNKEHTAPHTVVLPIKLYPIKKDTIFIYIYFLF
jgi:hypothetical protein